MEMCPKKRKSSEMASSAFCEYKMFGLNWDLKDMTINVLNKFLSLLCGKAADKQFKKKLFEECNKCIECYDFLPIFGSDIPEEKYFYLDKSLIEMIGKGKKDIKLNISWQTLDEIVCVLRKNRNFIIIYPEADLTDDVKEYLIRKNKMIGNFLMNINTNFQDGKYRDMKRKFGR